MNKHSSSKTTVTYYMSKNSEFWNKSDIVPKSGTILINTDTDEIKIADGVHKWSELEVRKDDEVNE